MKLISFFFTPIFFFFCKLGLLSVTFLWERLRVNHFFFFTMWVYQIRSGNSDAKKKQKTKQEARHNQTWIMFNQNPDSTFDFKKNQDSIKKFRITIVGIRFKPIPWSVPLVRDTAMNRNKFWTENKHWEFSSGSTLLRSNSLRPLFLEFTCKIFFYRVVSGSFFPTPFLFSSFSFYRFLGGERGKCINYAWPNIP